MKQNCGKIAIFSGAAAIGCFTVLLNSTNSAPEKFLCVKMLFVIGVFSAKNFIDWLHKPVEQKCCFDSRTRFITGLSARAAHLLPIDYYIQLTGE